MSIYSFNTLSDVRSFLVTYFFQNNISISSTGQISKNNILDSLWLDHNQLCRAFNETNKEVVRPFNKDLLKAALNELVLREVEGARESVTSSVAFNGEPIASLKSYVRALLGKDCELTTKVLMHWIWMVKRKLKGLSVTDHLMPVFVGPQGIGKSVAIEKLISPLNDFILSLSLRQVVDDRYHFELERGLITVLDELNGKNLPIEDIKRVISSDTLSVRKLGSNVVETFKNRVSFIGSSNARLSNVLHDREMRRFYEVNISSIDWKAINTLDYIKIWQSVDENRLSGYVQDVMPELRESQKSLVTLTPVETFLRDMLPEGRSLDSLYSDYLEFCIKSNLTPKHKLSFSKELREYGLDTKQSWIEGVRVRTVYRV